MAAYHRRQGAKLGKHVMGEKNSKRPYTAAVLALVVGLAALAGGMYATGQSPTLAVPQAQSSVEVLAIDTDPAGNSPTSLGTIDTCRQVGTGDLQVDVIIDRVPAGRNLAGLQFVIRFDSTKLQFQDADMAFILASSGGSPFPFSGEPDNDPDNPNLEVRVFGAVQVGGDVLTNVAGVAGRLTFKALAGGSSAIEILPSWPTNPNIQTKVINVDNTLIPISQIAGGTIAVSPSTCGQAPPVPVHTPAPISPTSPTTPGETPAVPAPQTTVTATPLPPATATAVAATAVAAATATSVAAATATATSTPAAETPGPGTPAADLDGEEPSSNGDDGVLPYIIGGALAGLAAAAGAAWVIRRRLRAPKQPNSTG